MMSALGAGLLAMVDRNLGGTKSRLACRRVKHESVAFAVVLPAVVLLR